MKPFTKIVAVTVVSTSSKPTMPTLSSLCDKADQTLFDNRTSCAGGRHDMPPPLQVDLESGVRVTCDVGYLSSRSVVAVVDDEGAS